MTDYERKARETSNAIYDAMLEGSMLGGHSGKAKDRITSIIAFALKEAVAAETELLRQSYLGIRVLRTMCSKAGLIAGSMRADEIVGEIDRTHPEFATAIRFKTESEE